MEVRVNHEVDLRGLQESIHAGWNSLKLTLSMEMSNRIIQMQECARAVRSGLPPPVLALILLLWVLRNFLITDIMLVVSVGFAMWWYRSQFLGWVAIGYKKITRWKLWASSPPAPTFQTDFASSISSSKLVNNKPLSVDLFTNRAVQASTKLFQTAAALIEFSWVRDQRSLNVASVKPVGIFGAQKVGKTTLLNHIFGLRLATGDSVNRQTTTGIDLSATSGFAVLDSEGAGSEDSLRDARNQLNTELGSHEDADVFRYISSYRANIELAFMAVVMTVCNPVVFCIESSQAVSEFSSKVLTMARNVFDGEAGFGGRTLIIVQNSCSLEYIQRAERSQPAWIDNVRASPEFTQAFASIEFVLVPNFNQSPQQRAQRLFKEKVDHLRDLINNSGDEKPFDQVISSVDQVVQAIQTTSRSGHVNVTAIWDASNQEFRTRVTANLKVQFAALARRFAVMTEDDFETVRDQIKQSISKLPRAFVAEVTMEMTAWMEAQFTDVYRACPEQCPCAQTALCKAGRVNHQGQHKCSRTWRPTCTRCTVREFRCNDVGCLHCPTTCLAHAFSLCTTEGPHTSHSFSCQRRQQCDTHGCNIISPNTMNCGAQFVCNRCTCNHTFTRKHYPKDGRGMFTAHWECKISGCRFNNQASRYHTIMDNQHEHGCMKQCVTCGFEQPA